MSYSKTDEEKSLLDPVKDIRSAELYYGSGSVGDRYLIIDGDDLETSQFVGAYANIIHSNGARSTTNITGTIATTLALNHNFIGIGIDPSGGTPYDDASGTAWPQLVAFLSHSQDTNIKVFAIAAPRKGIPSGSTNRWGVKGGYLKSGEFVEPPNSAARKWSAGAIELSKLSLTYPNLMGWTIDDFATKNDNKDSFCYTKGDVHKMVSSGKRYNPSFQFFPTHYVEHALLTAIPSTRIGFSYNFPTIADEYIGATLSFRMPSVLPTEADLHFVHSDSYTKTADAAVIKTMKINGHEIYSDKITGQDVVETTSADIQSKLAVGNNTLQVFISSSAVVQAIVDRVWNVGDIRILTNADRTDFKEITRENGRLTAPVFDLNGGVAFSSSCCNRFKGRPVAETNERYRYIAECPRTILVYSNHTGAIQSRLGNVFAAYNRTLPDTGLFHVQQGFLFNQNIPPTSVVQKFKSGSAYSDGQLVWNYPIYLQQPNKGIFSKRSAGTGYGVMTAFPRYQLAVRGQYQRWTTKKTYSGALKFKVKWDGGFKNYDPATGLRLYSNLPQAYWRTILANSGAAWPPANPYYNISGCHNYTTPISSSTISPASKLVYETFVTGGYGNSYALNSLSASVGDVFLSESAWDFTSGVTGSAMASLYSSVKTYYDAVAAGASSLNNRIITFKKWGEWEVYTPSDGDQVYINADKESRLYDASLEKWRTMDRVSSKGLTVTGAIKSTKALERGGILNARRGAALPYEWSVSDKSASVPWTDIPRIDTAYYSASKDSAHIRILEDGDYRISYGINWYQTGAIPPIGLKSYVVSSSFAAGSGSAASTSSIRTVPASSDTTTITTTGGGYTYGSHTANFITDLSSNDIIQLYVEHIYGSLPRTTSTELDQVWILLEKV
jgi:hypothetical protein